MGCPVRKTPFGRSFRILGRFALISTFIISAWLVPTVVDSAQSGMAARNAPNASRSNAPDRHPIQSAVHRVYRLLVEISGGAKGGTAFLVSGKRVIATNYHVIEDGTAYSVGFVDERGVVRRIPVRLLAIFPQKDLALLETLDDLPGAPLPLSHKYPAVATDLFAIGFPAAADPQGGVSWAQGDDTTYFIPSVVKGSVSRVLTNRWFSSQLQHQTPIIPGYSGGPLIDESGVVLAISTAIHKEANGISYGVLASDLADFIAACALPTGNMLVGSRPDVAGDRSAQATVSVTSNKVKKTSLHVVPHREMLAKGNDYLERGDIGAARLMYRYLIERSDMPEAFAGLAKTYDPIFLNEKKVIGVSGDFAKAHALYREAARLNGSAMEIRAGLEEVSSVSGCNDSLCTLINSATGPTVTCERNASRVARGAALAR